MRRRNRGIANPCRWHSVPNLEVMAGRPVRYEANVRLLAAAEFVRAAHYGSVEIPVIQVLRCA